MHTTYIHSALRQDLDANDKKGKSDYELQPGADVSLGDHFAIASPNYLEQMVFSFRIARACCSQIYSVQAVSIA